MNEIKIRTNLFLWLLTGRSKDFANETLNTRVTFTSQKLPAEVLHMRSLLKFDDRRTDFYVLGALGAVYMSTSLLRSMVSENQAVFVPGMLRLSPVVSSATLLSKDQFSWPYIDGRVAGRDGFTQVSLTYIDAEMVELSTDAGLKIAVAYELVSETGGLRLKVPTIYDYGIHADMRVGTWGPGDIVSVGVSPTRYPYSAMAEKLAQDSVSIRMMNEEGTLQAFSETSSSARKVGLAALAVIRRMLRITNDTQAGFTVEVVIEEEGSEPLAKNYTISPDLIAGLTSEPPCDLTEPQGFNA
jgi:hypothetical protein